MESNNPWKGLESYKYDDAGQFYGRDRELTELAEIIRQNSFTTIYGISGAGKTSIINAGLFPLLDKEQYLPVYIRLIHGIDRVSYDQQIINATEAALARIGGEAEKTYDIDIESQYDQLWLYFHSHTFWTRDNHKIYPVLFIDQFEEIFTKNEDVNDIWSFFNVIDSLQYNMPAERISGLIQAANKSVTFSDEANFRIVFSMREDFLPRLEDYCFDIPAMRRNRIGLKSLNGLQAIEVITKPCPDMVTREVALHIISKVVGKNIPDNPRKLETTLVDTSILSLFCTELYNYRDKAKDGGSITKPLVDLYGGNILEWFYDRNMQALPKRTYIYLEDHLLTHSGFRNSIAVEDLLENNVTQEQIDRLEENRIIRVEDINHSLRIEFSHDVLCKIAKKRKDARDSLSKAKDETSTRKAFTFDTVIFATVLLIGFVDVVCVRYDGALFLLLASLPFVGFFYLLFAHRFVSDKNFCILIRNLFIGLAIEFFLCFVCDFAYNKVDELGFQLLGKFIVGIFPLLILPYMFVTLPVIFNIYVTFKDKLRTKKNILIGTALYFSIPLYFSFLGYFTELRSIFCWVISLLPFILLCVSPFAILAKAYNRKAIKRINVVAALYTSYNILLVLLWVLVEYCDGNQYLAKILRLESVNCQNTYFATTGIIWGAIIILSVIYFIGYIRQPKDITMRSYMDNLMEFQSFKKYSSFTIRLKTILISFFVIAAAILGTTYYDVIPFVTLPLAVWLLLYAISKEIKFTQSKKISSPLLIILVVVTSEIPIILQYCSGLIPYTVTILIGLVSATSIICYFCHSEDCRHNKWLVTRITLYATIISFVLPSLCTGYNMLNPQLVAVSRVFGGRIYSNKLLTCFMTIENSEGDKGVMDYNEIIIEPKYIEIRSISIINPLHYSSIYPFANLLEEVLALPERFYFDEYYDYEYYDDHNIKNEINSIKFYCLSHNGKNKEYNYWSFMHNKNKIGQHITSNGLKILEKFDEYDNSGVDSIGYKYSDHPYVIKLTRAILSHNNRNLSSHERIKTICRIFLNTMYLYATLEEHTFDYPNSKNASDFVTALFCEAYEEGSFNTFIFDKEHSINSYQITQSVQELYPLLALDEGHQLSTAIFDRLIKKYAKDWSDVDLSYYLLFTKDFKKAKETAYKYYKEDLVPEENRDGEKYTNMCLVNYCTGNTSEYLKFVNEATHYFDETGKRKFMYNLVMRAEELDYWGVKKLSPELLDKASELLHQEKYSEKGKGGKIYTYDPYTKQYQEMRYGR